jgi:anaerobic selenocysteine-containing dehydrogenase
MEIVKTVCNMCEVRCGINVHVEYGKIIKVEGMPEHPLNAICVKAQAIPELVYSKERLTNPLRRVDGEFKEISWDAAFGLIADKLTGIKEKYGPQAVAIHVGNAFIATQTEKMIRRFSDLYGTPNYSTGGSYCFLASAIGHILTCGAHVLPHYQGNADCMILWGSNRTQSGPPVADRVDAWVGRGAKLIVIDPRVTTSAKKADLHAQIRPGTDCALALGMLNVIIAEGLYDKPFVEEWTVGFDKLAVQVKEYSPEKVEEITWVPAATVRNMARMYATSKPACIAVGIPTNHSTNGIQAIRAITILMAITGNIDVSGGNIITPGMWQSSIRVKGRIPSLETSVGAPYPLFRRYTIESTASPLTEAILSEKPYPIKALIVAGCNPVMTMPNTNKVKRAFSKLELLVVMDIFMTDTAKMAHIVLPGAAFPERQDLRHWRQNGLSLTVATKRVVEPVGNCMEDWKIWAELGKKMGYGEYFPWQDADELFEYLLKPSGITLSQLKQNPAGVYYAEREFQKYLKEGFETPSKKVELYSELMVQHGYDPLPTFREPAESPVSRPDLAKQYPWILTTGARTLAYLHSEYRNLPRLRKLVPEPLVEINRQTAASLGVANGDWVKVESLRGSIELKAKVTDDIHPKVVSIQHGWSEANANLLTDDEARDPVSGYPSFRSLLCRVTKVAR